jgi:HEAT repeat protein
MNLLLAAVLLCAAATLSLAQTVVPATKEQETKLLTVLKSDASQKEKADACRLLGLIGTKDAIAALAALLPDEKLSHMARYGLEPIPDPAVDQALRDALGKLKGPPLVGVIGSIGVRRDAQAVGPLATFLQDTDADVAQAAARALGSIGNQAAAKAIQGALAQTAAPNQLAFCEGLLRCAEALLAQGQRTEAIAAYDQLRKLQPAPHQVRAGALRGAILARQKEGLPLLRENLGNDDYILFSAAVQTAQQLPGADVTRALTAALPQLPADRQILVLQTLGERGDAAALSAVSQLAKSGEPTTRVAALKTLGQLGDASTVPVLFEAAVQPNTELARTAQDTLAGLASNKEVDAAILAMIEKGETKTRLVAIDVVTQRRAAAGNQTLFKAAHDPDKQIRLAAVNALGQTGEPEDLSGLLALLASRDSGEEIGATENAVQTLCGKVSNKEAAAGKLLAALPDARVEVKCALLRLLRVPGGPEALKAVRAATQDPNPQIQEAAFRSLSDWPGAEAAPDLLALAKTSTNTSRKIAALRGYIGLMRDESLSTEKKLAMAREAAALVERTEEKKLLLGVLGGVPAPEALALVVAHLDNPAIKNEASTAAIAISEKIVAQKPAEVADALTKVLQATDNRDLTRRAKQLLGQAKKSAGN